MVKRRGAYKASVWRPEGKMPLGRPRRRFEDNIKMERFKKWNGKLEWITLTQDRDMWRPFVNAGLNLWVL
jgi:hypothetical protein